MIASQPEESLRLRVAEAERRDVGRALVRVDPADIKRLGCKIGDIVRLSGEASAIGKLMPCKQEDRGKGLAQIGRASCRERVFRAV